MLEPIHGRHWFVLAGAAVLVLAAAFFAFYNLGSYPTTWFDEGSHLHVPKTLVKFGVYADWSSEGFRYYGPTIGVGPTVMLPIAAAFRLFGIGLLQARLVMAVYLLAAIAAYFLLARRMGTWRMAVAATALLVATPGIALIEYGRQVLGEVPGLFFLVLALALWLATWERSGWRRLSLVGLLLGLAIITKSQYLLIVAPSLGVLWLLNLVYYGSAPQRVFIVPGIIAGVCAVGWQAYLVLYLGPATASENFALLRQASAGAAFVFSIDLMRRSLSELASWRVYLGVLAPALIYGALLALPRNREGQRWSVLTVLILINLVWYVTASIGWLRYAFLGLSLTGVLAARFFADLTDDFSLSGRALLSSVTTRQMPPARQLLAWAAALWLVGMVTLPGLSVLRKVVQPDFNAPLAMAAYLDANVAKTAVIETWEPELGFLTDHTYHFPPAGLLDTAVGYIWRDGSPPAARYQFLQDQRPPYLLIGPFARWVVLYPEDLVRDRYAPVIRIGGYELYSLR